MTSFGWDDNKDGGVETPPYGVGCGDNKGGGDLLPSVALFARQLPSSLRDEGRL